MVRSASVALLVALFAGSLISPAYATSDPLELACPGIPVLPTTGTHEASLACLQEWGLGQFGMAGDVRLTRGMLGHALGDLVVRSGRTLRTPIDDPFEDDDGHPEETVFSQLAEAGLLYGRAAGIVEPEASTSRAQLTSLMVRTTELLQGAALDDSTTPFGDVAGTLHAAAIGRAYGAGLVRGATSELFSPGSPSTLGQYATMAVRMLGLLVEADLLDAPTAVPPFDVPVVPAAVSDTIPGQQLLLLVKLDRDEEPAAGPVAVALSADGATIPEQAALLSLGDVGELWLQPDAPDSLADPARTAETRIAVIVSATRGAERVETVVPVTVTPGEDDRRAAAQELLQRWVGWLADEHPQLGIDASTVWTPVPAKPHILIVPHYLFLSTGWELGLRWHVMIPPYDFTTIYLRPRGAFAPTLAFQIPSVSDPASLPTAIDPPLVVDR